MRQLALIGVVITATLLTAPSSLTAGQSQAGTVVSREAIGAFRVDGSWPSLPNNWVVGVSSSVAVDSHDNVWLLHRPRTVSAELLGRAAPAVIALNPQGTVIRAWGGPGEGYDWPDGEHGIFVDARDQVWITGNGDGDHMILKFASDGRFLGQLGRRGASTGNTDSTNLNRPAGLFLHPATNELFVADGYGNRRVAVFDADSLRFKRMWGAFGNNPIDRVPAVNTGAPPGQPDPGGEGVAQFDLVHAITVSTDGHVYVADRTNHRVQVFSLGGEYLTQIFLNRDAMPSAAGLALSPDPGQRFLYVADYGNSQIFTLDRTSLSVDAIFGMRGASPGDFQGVHHLAADSKGNLYTAEVAPGNRFQKFVPADAVP